VSSPSRELFTRIAGGYDRLNRVMSWGTDVLWRQWALARLEAELAGGAAPTAILDLATGTADLAIAAAKRFPAARVTGLDATPAMLAIGREKVERAGLGDRIELIEGDAEAPNLAEGSFEVVMCAFGFRNFPHPELALAAAAKALRPGGRLLVLELFRNESRLLGWLTSAWLWVVSRCFVGSFKGDYTYLRNSITRTRSVPEFAELAKKAGFSPKSFKFYPPACHCLVFGK